MIYAIVNILLYDNSGSQMNFLFSMEISASVIIMVDKLLKMGIGLKTWKASDF